MNKIILSLTILSILLSSSAQILLKMGMSQQEIGQAIHHAPWFDMVKIIATNLYVIGGLTIYFLSTAVWLFVLAKTDVSVAYPFVGLGFIITMLLAHFVHGEPLTAAKVLGTFLITTGVVFIARG